MTGEASGGIVLILSAALALIVANSPAAPSYFAALSHSRHDALAQLDRQR